MLNDEFLDKLVGRWKLTGLMGTQKLSHTVEAKWVFAHQFLKIDTNESDPETKKNPYEATYYIGWNNKKHHYVMNLIDTFGGQYSEIPGIGKKQSDKLVFEFSYEGGVFENSFEYSAEEDEWKMVLRFKNDQNEWQEFAVKNLKRM